MEEQVFGSNARDRLKLLLHKHPIITKAVSNIKQHGGSAYIVGGAVRDFFMNLPVKDIDIEVHGITLDALSDILKRYGNVNYIGKSFGVLKLEHSMIDWSLPRRDSAGRKPEVMIDVAMKIEEALRRRDLTMNAIALDLNDEKIIDPFGGLQDIRDCILRVPDKVLFSQDPLRFFRVMQFIGRFNMYPDDELTDICKTMDIASVSCERVEMEFEKLLLRSKTPSRGFRWLADLGRLHEILPELASLQSVDQDQEWHPEGDVFEHTMQSLDAAVDEECFGEREKIILLYAALCHDLGKVSTTKYIDGRIRSRGHDSVGVPLTKKMLKRIMHTREIIDSVALLVQYHMVPGQWIKDNVSEAAYKRLANKLIPPVTLHMLGQLCRADRRGRNREGFTPLVGLVPEVQEFMERARKCGVLYHPLKPLLHGRDFLEKVSAGPRLGEILRHAYKIQIENDIHDKDELKERTLKDFNL
jgi:tRNA nucleotidyltransferase (CCA-adding enzyme)